MKIRLGEQPFKSIQGESIYCGHPSIFVRFFGCNLRCPHFGLKDQEVGTLNQEVQTIIENLSQYKTLEDLPLVNSGCDSYYAIYPEFKHFAKEYSEQEIFDEIKLLSEGSMRKPHVVFTGGEPLLWSKALEVIIPRIVLELGIEYITFETNGTQTLSKKMITMLNELQNIMDIQKEELNILFSVSPKLSCSGHIKSDTFFPEALRSYNEVKNSILVLKFVAEANIKYFDEIFSFLKEYHLNEVNIYDVYIMPEGGNNDEKYQRNCKDLAKFCYENSFSYSPRLQVELFANKIGT